MISKESLIFIDKALRDKRFALVIKGNSEAVKEAEKAIREVREEMENS